MFFFRKKNTPSENGNVAKQSVKKMDTLVTGVILGGVIASLYGVKKIKDHSDKTTASNPDTTPVKKRSILRHIFFWKK